VKHNSPSWDEKGHQTHARRRTVHVKTSYLTLRRGGEGEGVVALVNQKRILARISGRINAERG